MQGKFKMHENDEKECRGVQAVGRGC